MFFQNNSAVYNAADICHNVKYAHFLEPELEQLSFTSMHIKSRVVTAGSFPFQKIKREKKSAQGTDKQFSIFSSTKPFQTTLLCACVHISGKKQNKIKIAVSNSQKTHLLILTKYPKKSSYKMQIKCHLFGLTGFKPWSISPRNKPINWEAAGSSGMGNRQPDSHQTINHLLQQNQMRFLIVRVKQCFHSCSKLILEHMNKEINFKWTSTSKTEKFSWTNSLSEGKNKLKSSFQLHQEVFTHSVRKLS